MAYSKAQGQATIKWKKANIKRIELNLNKENDKDIIEYLDTIDNVQGEIKRLLRARVQKNIFTNKQINKKKKR